MSAITETLGQGRLQTPRWLAVAILAVAVAIIATSVVRIANFEPARPIVIDEGRPAVVYPASERDRFDHGLVVRAGRQKLYHGAEA